MTHNTSVKLTSEQALFELTLLNAEAPDTAFDDFLVSALNQGLSAEIVTRLKELWSQTKIIAGELIAVGKIIVTKIIEFLKANRKLGFGMALGAAVATLVASIPFLGPLIAPLATVISMVYGSHVGNAVESGTYSGPIVFSAAIELAEKFFELLSTIFNAVIEYWKA